MATITEAVIKERENICQALRALPWNGVPVGHKAIIKAAIDALEAQNAKDRDQPYPAIVPFYSDRLVSKRMTDEMREFLKGMRVSVDVSDPEDPDDLGDKRIFGIIDCVEDNPGKHGVALLVWDPKPNFGTKKKKGSQPPTCEVLENRIRELERELAELKNS